MKLHGYFRSSAAYRVRIALNLKGLSTDHLPHHLRKGEQCAPAYLAINPQGLVPTLEGDDGAVLTQSLAIIEWLDETHPNPPLLPKDPLRRAKVRAFAHGARLRYASRAKSQGSGAVAPARRGRRESDGMGGLGQPRGIVRLRNAGRARGRPVLLRRQARRLRTSAWSRSLAMRGASASMFRPFRACWRRRPRPGK